MKNLAVEQAKLRERMIKRQRPKKNAGGRPPNLIKPTPEELEERRKRNRALAQARLNQKREGLGYLAECIAQIDGGIRTFSPFLRPAALRDPALAPLVEIFFKLQERERTAFRLEQMCFDLGVSPHHLLGVCTEIASETKQPLTRFLSYMAMPKVMKRNIAQAQKARGVEDRRMFMQSTGLLPVPKGSTINVSANAQSVTNQGEPTGLPSFEESTVAFSEIIRRAVEAPSQALPEPALDVVEQGDE